MPSPALLAMMGAHASAAAFDPFSVGWAAAYWADDPIWVNPGNGNAVSSWREGATNTYTTSQGTAGKRPIFRSSVAGLNGHGGVEFRRSSLQALIAVGSPNPSQTFSLVAVLTCDNAAAGTSQNVLSGSTDCIFTTSAGAAGAYGGVFNITGGSTGTGIKAMRCTFAGASSVLTLNGSTVSTSSPGFSAFGTQLVLGAYNAAATQDTLDGTLGFAAVYAGDVAAATQWSAFVSWVVSYYAGTIA